MLALALVVLVPLVAATTVTTDPNAAANKTFDYIIAGGGLTGITVANKVSFQLTKYPFVKSDTPLTHSLVLKDIQYLLLKLVRMHALIRQCIMLKNVETWLVL